jgi:hypothetical protein
MDYTHVAVDSGYINASSRANGIVILRPSVGIHIRVVMSKRNDNAVISCSLLK